MRPIILMPFLLMVLGTLSGAGIAQEQNAISSAISSECRREAVSRHLMGALRTDFVQACRENAMSGNAAMDILAPLDGETIDDPSSYGVSPDLAARTGAGCSAPSAIVRPRAAVAAPRGCVILD